MGLQCVPAKVCYQGVSLPYTVPYGIVKEPRIEAASLGNGCIELPSSYLEGLERGQR